MHQMKTITQCFLTERPGYVDINDTVSRFIKPYRSTELKESDGQKRSIVLKFNKEF